MHVSPCSFTPRTKKGEMVHRGGLGHTVSEGKLGSPFSFSFSFFHLIKTEFGEKQKEGLEAEFLHRTNFPGLQDLYLNS